MYLLQENNRVKSLHTTVSSPPEAGGRFCTGRGSENISEARVSRQGKMQLLIFAVTFLKTRLLFPW